MKLTEHLFNIAKGTFAFSGIKTFTDGLKTQGQHLTPYGKNYIINGGFDYWNYATSQTTGGYGSDDRWRNGNAGSTKVHSMVNSTDTERALFNSSKFSRTEVTSVAGAGNTVIKHQKIENITKLAGKTVTLSFWAKADSSKNIAIDIQQVFGNGGTPSAPINGIGAQLIALTNTWQKKTITIQIPSIIGKTLGTDGVNTSSTELYFWFDAGSNFNARTASLGQQSGTFDIAEVKLEEGSVATPWTPYEGEFGGELQACQRYYEVVPFINWAYSVGATTGAAGVLVKFTAIKRASPTAGTITVTSSIGTNTYSIDSIGTSVARLVYNSTQAGIVGATGSVPFSAEL